ncbi:BBP7 family outer membrane beta-barrel protein [Blastopirellula marina]|nr:BBP7 family outer membrane beta-barrel protein [Blastopirellula marina]
MLVSRFPAALALTLSASGLFAAPVNLDQPSSLDRPSYFAPEKSPAQLWRQNTQPVSLTEDAPAPADKIYAESLEPGMMPSAAYGESYGSGCASDGGCYDECFQDCFCPTWFAYAGALAMTRDNSNEVWLSNDSGDYAARTMGSNAAGMGWKAGYELRFGRHFGCSNWAWEVDYWAVRGTASHTVTNQGLIGQLDTPLDANFQGLTYNGSNVDDYYNNAQAHRLQRSYDFYNVELNFFQDPNFYNANCCGGNVTFGALAGLRYFKVREGFAFSTDPTDYSFNGADDELHYDIDVDNNLIGAQLGMIMNYNFDRLNLYAKTKFGIYGNAINQQSRMYGNLGNAYIDNALSPNNGRQYDVSANKGRVSFLGELDLGAGYQLTKRFSINGGYRVVAASGIALATEQIPQNFEDLGIVASTPSNGDLLLHGGYLGGQFIW